MRRRFFKGAIRNDCIIFEVLNGYISFGLSRNPIEYSLDDGISWMKLNAGEITPTYTNIPRVLIKCNPTYIGLNDGIGSFTVYGEFNLSGNVMALLGGRHHLKEKIFYNLFKETSVVNVSKTFLPATTLADSCYDSMFSGCRSLTTAPELPATTLADSCYNSMFRGCTSLVNAPALPATTLAVRCYDFMFQNCTSLVNAPVLPATTLAEYCYDSMFSGCINLVNAPELPAITLKNGCYKTMFYNCIGLTTAPELPATTLADNCYNSMFRECTKLTTAPALPATTLADGCYYYMFDGCTKLNYIKMLATDISATSCLSNWVSGVSSTGTFVKNKNATWNVTGTSGIPSGWTVVNDGEESGGNLITFTYAGIEYYAEEGMTWWQFINSTYNDGTFTAESSTSGVFERVTSGFIPIGYNYYTKLYANAVIEDKHIYTAFSGGGSDD